MSIIESVLVEFGWSPSGARFLYEHASDAGRKGRTIQSLLRKCLGLPPFRVSRPATPPAMREKIAERDGRACARCGTNENLTVDHIIPWSRGGSDEAHNLQLLCGSCNSKKGAR
jgi:hypothetical protein